MTLAPDAVRTMFDRIAPVYDVMNRVMTAGLDVRWRRLAAAAVVRPGDRVLDAACGTGDLAVADLRAGAASVTGLDFSARMLERARRKAPAVDVGRGRHARAAVRGRELRRGDGRLRDPECRRPRARAARAAPGAAPGRAARDPRDHAAARPAAAVLLALVRPDRAVRSGGCSRAAGPTPTCPRRCGASRRPRSSPRSCAGPGSPTSGSACSAGSIVALHSGTAVAESAA